MTPQVANSYDQVAYVGYPFAQTHPERLATVAMLFGLQPAPAGDCRVLELGCGDGGNLIPMAFTLPDSSFVGIDLASETVARGTSMIAELGLTNIELQCADIMQFDAEAHSFDYIIAHGVFSWIPQTVRLRIMQLCRKLLAPHGVAYISYNCYPGYHIRNLTREMMRFHTRAITDPKEQVQQGLSLLQWLLHKFPDKETASNDLYGALLTEQLDLLMGHRHREQIYHDDLNPENTPFYFYQFNALAEQHDLQYLGEADYFEMQDFIYPDAIRETLGRFPTEQVVLKEQYLDFLKCRVFRQTLLTHAEAPIRRPAEPSVLTRLYLSSEAKPDNPSPNLDVHTVETFHGLRGAKLQTDYPLAKAALLVLGKASPRWLGWEELLQSIRARLTEAGMTVNDDFSAEEQATLAEILLAACGSGLVHPHAQASQFTTDVSERPKANLLALTQAQRGSVVTNLLHKSVEIEDTLGLLLLQLLDGTRDRAALRDQLLAFIAQNGAFAKPDGSLVNDKRGIQEIVTNALETNLQKIARLGLLIE